MDFIPKLELWLDVEQPLQNLIEVREKGPQQSVLRYWSRRPGGPNHVEITERPSKEATSAEKSR
jgi:hypothetical protein